MARPRSVLAVVVALAGTAAAQPTIRPEHECRVVIALAPDDVRAEIEAWVRAEPRCLRELEVRVVPTEDGLYLSATDARGHVRERVVPDAQSAAVLVVSWMADDSLGPRLPVRAALDPAPATAPTYAVDREIPSEVMAPGLVRSMERRDAARGRRWLTFGAIGSDDGGGLRAQIDLFAGRMWSIGLAGAWRDGDHDASTSQARLVIGASHALGRITVRAQLGIGADVGAPNDRMERDAMDSRDHHPRVLPAIEAGLLAKLRITDAWGLVGGPIVEATPEVHPSLSVFLGVQYGL